MKSDTVLNIVWIASPIPIPLGSMKHKSRMKYSFVSYPRSEGLSNLVQLGTNLFLVGKRNKGSCDPQGNDTAGPSSEKSLPEVVYVNYASLKLLNII